MANGNTSAGRYLAFPTFGGGGGGGGITQVKLPAAQMRFPTARGPVRRAPEPTLKETLAPFLPIALEGIGSLLKKDPEKLTREEFFKTRSSPLANDNTLAGDRSDAIKEAQYSAYEMYGDPKEKDGFGFDDVLSMVIGSQMGRGAEGFATSSRAIDKAKETSRLENNRNRAAFLASSKLGGNLQYVNVESQTAADLGIDIRRVAVKNPNNGQMYVQNDEGNAFINILDHQDDWILQRQTGSLARERDGGQDKMYDYLITADEEIKQRDAAALGTAGITNKLVSFLDEGVERPEDNPLAVQSAIYSFANDMTSNVNSILQAYGGGNVLDAFATQEDVDAGNSPNGNGDASKALWIAIQSGDEAKIVKASDAFERANPEVDLEEKLGKAAFSNIRTRGLMLQLAYMAAATAGQTGRTLSDKDLANFLDMVGFGATNDAETAKENVLDFIDTVLRGNDDLIQIAIAQNDIQSGRYNLFEPTQEAKTRQNYYGQKNAQLISSYYNIPTIGGKRDWADVDKYTFRNIWQRQGRMGTMKTYFSHQRAPSVKEFDINAPNFWLPPKVNEGLTSTEFLQNQSNTSNNVADLGNMGLINQILEEKAAAAARAAAATK